MLAIQHGRWVVKCNECPIRIDVAPAAMPEDRLRMPTGWLSLGDGAHICMQCATGRWLRAGGGSSPGPRARRR